MVAQPKAPPSASNSLHIASAIERCSTSRTSHISIWLGILSRIGGSCAVCPTFTMQSLCIEASHLNTYTHKHTSNRPLILHLFSSINISIVPANVTDSVLPNRNGIGLWKPGPFILPALRQAQVLLLFLLFVSPSLFRSLFFFIGAATLAVLSPIVC